MGDASPTHASRVLRRQHEYCGVSDFGCYGDCSFFTSIGRMRREVSAIAVWHYTIRSEFSRHDMPSRNPIRSDRCVPAV